MELEPGKALCGAENWRQIVWGAKIMTTLGLELIPSLRNSDVYAEGNSLDKLENEANLIMSQLYLISRETGAGKEAIEFRVRNILEAIGKAKEVNGTVYIG